MATLQQRYDLAVEAYDKLVRGESVRVVVDQNGERVEYSPANAVRLAAYIADLARQLGTSQNTGPMRVWM